MRFCSLARAKPRSVSSISASLSSTRRIVMGLEPAMPPILWRRPTRLKVLRPGGLVPAGSLLMVVHAVLVLVIERMERLPDIGVDGVRVGGVGGIEHRAARILEPAGDVDVDRQAEGTTRSHRERSREPHLE